MATIGYTKHEPILECICTDESPVIKDGDTNSFLLKLPNDKWIFPWKIKCIDMQMSIRLSDGIQALITGCPWMLDKNIHVHPQSLSDDTYVYIYVHRIGLLPKKLPKGTVIARLTPVESHQCHLLVEHIEGQS